MQKDFNIDQIAHDICQKIIDKNPYGFILRPDLKEKTGGLLNGSYHKNLDCIGKGIKNRFRVGNTTAYPIADVIEFLKEKIVCPAGKTSVPHLNKQAKVLSRNDMCQN